MAIPTNLTALTAIDLGTLPAAITQDVRDAGTATTYTVWYKYTPVVHDLVLGVFAYGDPIIYRPSVGVYQGFPTGFNRIPQDHGFPENFPVQFPIEVGVFDAYYFEVSTNSSTAAPAILLFDVRRAPIDAARAGDIFVIDDEPVRPAAVLSPTTSYQVRRFVSGIAPNIPPRNGFVGGEHGDILPNGHMLIPNELGDGVFYCFDQTFAVVATPALPPISGVDGAVRANRGANNFYVAVGTAVRVVDAQGVLAPAVHTVPTVVGALAADAGETVLYHARPVSSGSSALHRWNLTTDVAMTDLAAHVANYDLNDILVLPDDSLLALYAKVSIPTDTFVRHYDTTGAIVQTYGAFGPVAASIFFSHLAYALDPTTFWVWIHLSAVGDPNSVWNGISRFQNVRISDGAILASVDYAEYEDSIYAPAETATPLARFGNSESCPFFILTQDESPATPLPAACPAPTPSPPSSLPSTGAAPVFP